MATQVVRIENAGAQVTSTDYELPGFVNTAQRVLSFVVAHQQRGAELRLRPFLARQSDEALRELGYTPAEIRAVRRPDTQ